MNYRDAAIEANALKPRAALLAERLTAEFKDDIGGIRLFGTADVMDAQAAAALGDGIVRPRTWPRQYKVVLAMGWYDEDGDEATALPFEPSMLDADHEALREAARTIRYFYERADHES